jgi:replicative DNA helicase
MSQPIFQKLPPVSDPRQEQTVLAACMVSPKAVADVAKVGLAPSHFFVPAHRAVFKAICRLAQRNAPVEQVSVAHDLAESGSFEDEGLSHALLAGWVAELPHAVGMDWHAKQIIELARRRNAMNDFGRRAIDAAGKPTLDAF